MAFGSLFLVACWSFVSSPPGGSPFPGADKVEHALGYFATTLLFILAEAWRPVRGPGRFAWALPRIVIGAIAVGGLVEIGQGFTATRQFDVLDWAADTAGVALAVLAIRTLKGRFPEDRVTS